MSFSSTSYSRLPTSLTSQTQTISNVLTSLRAWALRKPLYSVLLAVTFFLFLLSSFKALFGGPKELISFPANGLKKELWRELNALGERRIVLEVEDVEWRKESRMEDPVPWYEQPLFADAESLSVPGISGAGSAAQAVAKSKAVSSATTPTSSRHRIPVYPRIPLVPSKAPKPSKLMFGVVTTVERAKIMSELWLRWMLPPSPPFGSLPHSTPAPTEDDWPACLVLLSKEEEEGEEEKLRKVLEAKGLRCGVKTSRHERYEVRVMSMIVEMKDYGEELGREFDWYVFQDDDTFWLDLRTLRRMLSKYSPLSNYFIGATTEAKNQLESFGRMAFGGAGMVVSTPLMGKMYDIWGECYEKYRQIFGGDEMLTRCAARAKGATKATVTTEEKGMHQFDIPGDTTGVLQSGIPFLNLHHYIGGSWVHLFGYGSYRPDFQQITLLKRNTEFLGGDNMFKRYVFGNGKWLFVNGYSITLFEEALKKEDLALMEHTWYEGYRLSFEDRPVIPERHDWDGQKVKQTFYADDIKVLSPTSAIFTYVMADKWDEHLSSKDRVRLEVVWDSCAWNGNEVAGCEERQQDLKPKRAFAELGE